MRIAITGATGLLGRNLLFEFIKKNLENLDDLELVVLGRGKRDSTIQDRGTRIILEDGLFYLDGNNGHAPQITNYCRTRVRCLEADLLKPHLGLSPRDVEVLRDGPIDFFFHLAALSDFSDSPRAVAALRATNVSGTRQVLDLVRSLDVREFCYVGTAYSCGSATGRISPDHANLDQPFRNHYESTKLEGELLVQAFEKETGVRCRYFRPAVICGRLMEAPPGAACKFDAFYACAAFLHRARVKLLGRERLDESLHLGLRVYTHPHSALNIVPVDYVAKVLAEVCLQDAPGKHFHIVNPKDTPFDDSLVPLILQNLRVTGTTCVDRLPADMTETESLYYRSVGLLLTPYMTAEPMAFDTANIESVLDRAGIRCPDVNDRGNFAVLMNYAKQRDFGLRLNGNGTT